MCFVIPPNSKIEKTAKNSLLDACWLTNLPRFQGARPDHVRIDSSSCCFPGELVSFVCPGEFVSLHPRHMTRHRNNNKL